MIIVVLNHCIKHNLPIHIDLQITFLNYLSRKKKFEFFFFVKCFLVSTFHIFDLVEKKIALPEERLFIFFRISLMICFVINAAIN